MTGYNDAIGYNSAINYNGGGAVATAASGVMRLANAISSGQVIGLYQEKKKIEEEEEEVMIKELLTYYLSTIF